MLMEGLKSAGERLTGLGVPPRVTPRRRKPHLLHFRDDGETPNNPTLPLILYRSPVHFLKNIDPAAMFEALFEAHDWSDGWRDGIYDYNHFHTGIHEVLGIARGSAKVRFGGKKGRVIELKAGDVVIQPAGTGHQRLSKSRDLLVVGAYPPRGRYDEPRPSEVDHGKAIASIKKTPLPATDPVYGRHGPLKAAWK